PAFRARKNSRRNARTVFARGAPNQASAKPDLHKSPPRTRASRAKDLCPRCAAESALRIRLRVHDSAAPKKRGPDAENRSARARSETRGAPRSSPRLFDNRHRGAKGRFYVEVAGVEHHRVGGGFERGHGAGAVAFVAPLHIRENGRIIDFLAASR